jgi:hypothetical protein
LLVHGRADQRWTLAQIKTLIGRWSSLGWRAYRRHRARLTTGRRPGGRSAAPRTFPVAGPLCVHRQVQTQWGTPGTLWNAAA